MRAAPSQARTQPARSKATRAAGASGIYHLPGMPGYTETRAEQMFCSEADAQAAGYRRSRAR
ncbi:sunset domain-containing protein [Tsuneonella sp. HG222]